MEPFTALNAAVNAATSSNPGTSSGMFGAAETLSNPISGTSSTNNSNVQAMLAVLRAAGNGGGTNIAVDAASIPSQSSAFALLRHCGDLNGTNGSSLLLPTSDQQHQQQQQQQVALMNSNILSKNAQFTGSNLSMIRQQHQQLQQQELNEAFMSSVNGNLPAENSASNNPTATMALADMLTKIRQQFVDASVAKNNPLSSQLLASGGFNGLPSHPQSHTSAIGIDGHLRSVLDMGALNGLNTANVTQLNAQIDMRSSLDMSTIDSPGSVQTSQIDGSNPVRRIRRRRPKSPRQIKSVSGSTRSIEYQPVTPDDPIINSPPSIVRLPAELSMPVDSVDMSDENKMHRLKACLVCGDNATGYNFNVITCESCKAFFRRNALRPKDFKCPYNDECGITQVTRRFCQKCRLRKCFAVGMKKEWILNDDQLKRRKNSRLNNKGPSSVKYMSPGSNTGSQTPATPQSVGSINGSSFLKSPLGFKTEPRSNAFFAHNQSIDHSPPSVQSASSSGISMSPDAPNNGVLPQIEPGEDQYNPNIMNIRSSANNVPYPILTNVQASVAASCAGVSSAAINAPTTSYVPPLPAAPPVAAPARLDFGGLASFVDPPKMDTLLNREDTNVVIPMKEYQRLFQLNSALTQYQQQQQLQQQHQQQQQQQLQLSGNQPLTNGCGFEPMDASSSLAMNIKSLTQLVAMRQPFVQNYLDQQNLLRSIIKPIETPNTINTMTTLPPSTTTSSEVNTTTVCTLSPGMKRKGTPIHDVPSPDEMTCGFHIMSEEDREETILRARRKIDENISDEFYNGEKIDANKLDPITTEFSRNMSLQDMLSDERFRLSSYEMAEIEKIRSAFRYMDAGLDKFENSFSKKSTIFTHLFNLMDISMRRIVKVTKELESFQQISSDGRLQLLRAAMIDLLSVRGVMYLDKSQKYFSSPALGTAKLSTDFFAKLNNPGETSRFFNCGKVIHEDIRTNRLAMYMFSLFILFDHYKHLSDPRDQEISMANRDNYQYLLKRYIESIHGSKAAKMLETMPIVLPQLYKVGHYATTAFCGQVSKDETPQLTAEFFKIDMPTLIEPKSNDKSMDEPVNVVEDMEADGQPLSSQPAPINESGAAQPAIIVDEKPPAAL